MTVADRREALYQKHITAAGLARELGVSRVTVHLVINGERRSPKVEKAIAKALKMPLATVFDPAPVKRPR